MNTKYKLLPAVLRVRNQLRKKKKKVVFTNGCFDLIHAGHVRYLQHAKRAGDVLIVGMNTDASVGRIKGRGRPLVSGRDRAEVLGALACVDHIVFFNENTPERLIGALKPDVLIKGSDWREKDIVGSGVVKRYGGKIRRIRLAPGRSTTNLIKKIVRIYGQKDCKNTRRK